VQLIQHGVHAQDSANHPNMSQTNAKIAYKVMLMESYLEMVLIEFRVMMIDFGVMLIESCSISAIAPGAGVTPAPGAAPGAIKTNQ